jgi:preprotein translocase subunit SecE
MATLGTSDDAAEITGSSNEGTSSTLTEKLAFPARIRHFWHEIGLEMKKVSWPARSEVVSTTVIVVIAVFFFAAYLFVADILFTYVIEGLEWGAQKLFG